LKFRFNPVAQVPRPYNIARRLLPTPFARYFPAIPVANVVVADHVPQDELAPLKRLFFKIQIWLYGAFSPMQPGLGPIPENAGDALRQAYPWYFRALFPLPRRPESYAEAVPDLGGLAVRGPYAPLTEAGTDGRWHWRLSYLSGFERHPGLEPIGCVVNFRHDDRRLVPESIECAIGQIRPSDQQWPLAVALAMCACTTHTSLVRHFNWVHLAFGGPAAMATRNWLPANHPVLRLLWPHIFGTQYSNELVTEGQMAPGGDFADIFSFTHKGMCTLFSETYDQFAIENCDPRQDAARRGLAHAPFDTPTEDDLAAMFDLILAHAKGYVSIYYGTDDEVAKDQSLLRWRKSLNELIPNGTASVCPAAPTRAELAHLCAIIIYTATVQHDLVGSFLWNYQLWADAQPVRVYRTRQAVSRDIYKRLVNANFILNVRRVSLLQDFGYMALDSHGRGSFRAFLESLQRLDQSMGGNAAPVWKLRPGLLEANINA
jgi:arachidonate 15-lipoxygenase